jgi:hypothetical protein
MKTIYKNDEPQEILQWKSKFKNKNGRVPRYSDLNEVENLPHKILLKIWQGINRENFLIS